MSSLAKRTVVSAAAVSLLLAGVPSQDAAGARSQPNIVLILTDDQTLSEMRAVPAATRLIGRPGAVFRDFIISYPLCCPSRATFLTGQYAHNHGVLDNDPPTGGFYRFDSLDTLPVWLQQDGYYTVHVGKYLNDYGEYVQTLVPPGWNDWEGLVDPSTYQYYGYTVNDNGSLAHYGHTSSDYQTDVLRERAVAAIHRYASSHRNSPLYMDAWFLAPHRQVDPVTGDETNPRCAPRYQEAFDHAPLPPDPSYNEADMSDKPLFMQLKPRLTAKDQRTILERYRAELCSLLAVNDAIRAIMAELRADELLDDTYVFFASDNGYFHGEHRTPDQKILGYEPSIHVPFMVRGPGIRPGTTVDELTSNVDYAPTVVDLTGATPGLVMDGRSFLPYVRDSRRRSTRPIVIEASFPFGSAIGFFAGKIPRPGVPGVAELPRGNPIAEGDGPPKSPLPLGNAIMPYEGLRTDRYVYIEYATGERELYDLKQDPYELRSAHLDPRYAQIEARLAAYLALMRACVGPTCRLETGPMPPPGR